MLRIFQEALDLQEHISVSLHQPEEVQKLVKRSHAEEVIRWNAQTVAARLRVLVMTSLPSPANAFYDGKANWRTEKSPPASG